MPPTRSTPMTDSVLAGWQALDDPIASQHPTINREVSAHHESTHGSVFLGQVVRFVSQVGLIFSTIDKN